MSASLNIALVEDHEKIRVSTAAFLRKQGHHVYELECAEDMESVVGGNQIDLFILDLNLPGEDGLDFAARLRIIQPQVGIIMMSARGHSDHIAKGYQGGADVYLVKPVTAEILLGAIESVRRRLSIHAQNQIEVFRLDLGSLTLTGPSGKVLLNQSEAATLAGLIRAPKRILDIYQVSRLMGQTEEGFNQSSIVVRIVRLRKKLMSVGADHGCIKTHRMSGYQLCTIIGLS